MTTPTMPLDCDGFAAVLADYLEGDAPESVRSAVDSHASACAACRELLVELNSLRVDAAALPALTPSRDLWAGISERIDARVLPLEAPRAVSDIPKRRSWVRPALAAAALVAVTAGVTHYLTRVNLAAKDGVNVAAIQPSAPTQQPAQQVATTVAGTTTPRVIAVATPTARISSTASEQPATPGSARPAQRTTRASTARLVSATQPMHDVEPMFATEISKLRKIVRERRSQLDPQTVAVLEQSIAVIDSAIVQSRAALEKDPASGFLATLLNHSLEKKVELLRTVALLPPRT